MVGTLKVVSTEKHAFTMQDVHTLQVMGSLVGGALGQELEIERRRKLEGQLRYLAQFDPLTGLPNRALFTDRLSQAIINNRRSGKQMAILYMDIDHFKNINDKYGHAEGDALLKSFSERISGVLRKGDTLARLGGDEFVIIAENLHGPADAEHIASKVLAALHQPFTLPTIEIKIGASIGVAISTQAEINGDDIVGRADEALYEVKRAGRNNFKLVSLA
jgi:diguanylate cyclase (GGDEF)-like protein